MHRIKNPTLAHDRNDQNQNQKKTRDDLRNKTKKHVLKILINKQINKQNF